MTSKLSDPSDLGTPGVSPYIELDRDQWSTLASSAPPPLTQADVEKLRGLGDPIDLAEVDAVHRPLAALLEDYTATSRERVHRTGTFLGVSEPPTPSTVVVAGPVVVGKSMMTRLITHLLGRFPDTPRVDLVTIGGLLLLNRVPKECGLMIRKGFPEFYNRHALLEFVAVAKSGSERTQVPVYSHTVYDIVPDWYATVERPDILMLERLSVLQSTPWGSRPGASALAASGFINFSIHVDTDPDGIRRWYLDRFLTLKHTAFTQPGSHFRRFAEIPDDVALVGANEIWESVNLVNLRENIAPTRGRTTLVLTKDVEHRMGRVLPRKSWFLVLTCEAPVGRAAWGGTLAVGSLERASRVTRSLPTGPGVHCTRAGHYCGRVERTPGRWGLRAMRTTLGQQILILVEQTASEEGRARIGIRHAPPTIRRIQCSTQR